MVFNYNHFNFIIKGKYRGGLSNGFNGSHQNCAEIFCYTCQDYFTGMFLSTFFEKTISWFIVSSCFFVAGFDDLKRDIGHTCWVSPLKVEQKLKFFLISINLNYVLNRQHLHGQMALFALILKVQLKVTPTLCVCCIPNTTSFHLAGWL